MVFKLAFLAFILTFAFAISVRTPPNRGESTNKSSLRTFPSRTHEKPFKCVLSTFVCELYIVVCSLVVGNHLRFKFKRQNVVANIVNIFLIWNIEFIAFFRPISLFFFAANQFCKVDRFRFGFHAKINRQFNFIDSLF